MMYLNKPGAITLLLAAHAWMYSLYGYAEIVMHKNIEYRGTLGEYKDDTVVLHSEKGPKTLTLSHITDARLDEEMTARERAQQQARIDRLTFVIPRDWAVTIDVKYRVADLLKSRHFDELEELASRYLEQGSRTPGGQWKIHWFYEGMTAGVHSKNVAAHQERIELVEQWMAARPQSMTARIAWMSAMVDLGWAHRGKEYSNTLTSADRRKFSAALRRANSMGAELRAGQIRDPSFYRILINVYLGLGADKAEILALLDESASVEASYMPPFFATLNAFLPRWGGSAGLINYLINEHPPTRELAANAPEYYYLLAVRLKRAIDLEDYSRFGLDWQMIQQSFSAYQQRYESNEYDVHNMAQLAVLHHDREAASYYFNKTTGEWTGRARKAWRTQSLKDSFYAWVQSDSEDDSEAAFAIVLENLKGGTLAELFEQKPEILSSPDVFGSTLLHKAVDARQPELVQAIALFADVDARDAKGHTPLYLAARTNAYALIESLLEAGANPDMRYRSRLASVLHDTARKGYTESMQALLNARPDLVNSVDKYGETPLMWAVEYKREDAVKLLLRQDAIDIDARDSQGASALTTAAKLGHDDIARFLIYAGADVNISDWWRRYPLDLVKADRHPEIVKLLSDNGAIHSPNPISNDDIAYSNQLFEKASAKARERALEEMAAIHSELLAFNEYDWRANFYRGLYLLQEKNDPQQAAPLFERVTEIKPDYADGWYLAGRAYQRLNRADKYEAYFEHYIRLAPDSPHAKDLVQRRSQYLPAASEYQNSASSKAVAPWWGQWRSIAGGLAVLCLLGLMVKIRSTRLRGE